MIIIIVIIIIIIIIIIACHPQHATYATHIRTQLTLEPHPYHSH